MFRLKAEFVSDDSKKSQGKPYMFLIILVIAIVVMTKTGVSADIIKAFVDICMK